MAIFGPKPWVNPFGKSSIFRHFELQVFIAQKGAFSFQIIVKVIFLTNIALQKRQEKWPYLEQNHKLTPLENLQFFDILNFLFLQPRKAFFRSRISQDTFSWSILRQKKVRKMAIFGPKPWVNPFGKMSIFRLFELLVFIAQKGVFSFQNIVKVIFLTNIALKKKLEKWPYLDQNHGLTLLEKCQFFEFLNFLFLLPTKALFCSRIS